MESATLLRVAFTIVRPRPFRTIEDLAKMPKTKIQNPDVFRTLWDRDILSVPDGVDLHMALFVADSYVHMSHFHDIMKSEGYRPASIRELATFGCIERKQAAQSHVYATGSPHFIGGYVGYPSVSFSDEQHFGVSYLGKKDNPMFPNSSLLLAVRK